MAAHTTLPQSLDTDHEHLRYIDFSGDDDGDEVAVDIVSSSHLVTKHPTVSPVSENFFDADAWEPLPTTAHRFNPPVLPMRANAPALLELPEVVFDFGFQGRVLARITQLLQSGIPTSLLSVQPTSSGKGAYAPAMAKFTSK